MKKIIGILTTLLILGACAKDAPDPMEGMSDDTFRQWIALNAPKAKLVEDNIYIEFVEQSGKNPEFAPDYDSSWVQIRYTGRKLDGTVFVTRYENLYHLANSIVPKTTHFADEFVGYGFYYSTMNVGLRRGLREMREGDSARIYIPAKYGYANSSALNTGYIVDKYLNYVYIPMYFDIRLERITNDPLAFELANVNSYAAKVWNQIVTDTVTKGVYIHKTTLFPEADTIADDISVPVDVTEYFLDGFIIKTTMDSIAKAEGIYSSSISYNSKNVSISGTNEGENRLLAKILPKMRRGEHAEIICTSEWTEGGNVGSNNSLPQINSFTPRFYKIWVHPDTTTTTPKIIKKLTR